MCCSVSCSGQGVYRSRVVSLVPRVEGCRVDGLGLGGPSHSSLCSIRFAGGFGDADMRSCGFEV